MVLELKASHGADFSALQLVPNFLSYVLSFLYVAIYWNNHHHMLHAAKRVSGGVVWANLSLLFWLSLFPFATAWMGENPFKALPSAAYGFVLLMAAISYYVLQQSIIAADGPGSLLKRSVGADWKGKASPALYVAAMFVAFWAPWSAQVIYVAVALLWLVPDRRIERAINRYET